MSVHPDHATSPTDGLQPGLGNVLFDVWLVSRAVHALIDETIRPSGLDADEFAVYSVLAGGDAMTPTALASWMAAPATTVSSYIKRFERRGHVRRAPNPDDRRSHLVQLTAAGRKAHVIAGHLFRPLLDEINEAIGTAVPDTEHRLLAVRQAVDAINTAS